jgi:excisionase family DNA binding protein
MIDLPADVVEALAERVAEVLAQRQDAEQDRGFIDVAGAADFLACPASRIYSLVSARRIPFHKDGSRLLFDTGELRDYVRRGGARRP